MRLHFDGHGINDEEGRRIAKVSLKREDDTGRGVNLEFIQFSLLLASSPELLDALKALVDYHESDYEVIPEVEQARNAIAKAETLENWWEQ